MVAPEDVVRRGGKTKRAASKPRWREAALSAWLCGRLCSSVAANQGEPLSIEARQAVAGCVAARRGVLQRGEARYGAARTYQAHAGETRAGEARRKQ